jgi:predicted 2-oxoglutarate/Fe(II)-dependent dioxygenase YbiX
MIQHYRETPEVLPIKFVRVTPSLLDKIECEELIALTEEKGYEAALVNTGGGRQQLMPEVRNNKRCIIDDPVKAEELYQKCKHLIPQQAPNGWYAVGLNERLRFLKYNDGEYFAPHYDGTYVRDARAGDLQGEKSFVTFQLYLNEGFVGGETTFISEKNGWFETVTPRTGSVLLFHHPILHEGSLLVSGTKYALRTDVMYSRYPDREYSCIPVQLPDAHNAAIVREEKEETPILAERKSGVEDAASSAALVTQESKSWRAGKIRAFLSKKPQKGGK